MPAAGLPIYAGPAVTQVITQADGEISRLLGVTASPFGIAVDDTGTVRAVNVPGSFADIASLADACHHEHA